MKITQIMVGLLLAMTTATTLHAQTSAFTYQGRLNLNDAPADGIYDLRFTIYDALTGGGAAGGPLTNTAVTVNHGLFSVLLDFGAGVFNGEPRWLEINVRTNGGGAFTTLSPRQEITSTPYAIHSANAASAATVSGSVSAAQLTGTIAANNIGAGSITTAMLAVGAVTSNQLADGAVTTGALADGAVTAHKIATVALPLSMTTFTNPTPALNDSFGISIASLSPDHILIGAFYGDAGASDSGAVYLFSTDGTLCTTLTNPTPAIGDSFGVSVAAVGNNRVLIGSWQDDTSAFNAGAAYLFDTNGALLTTFSKPTPEVGDFFGHSVAAVGTDRVLIAAVGDDIGAADAGAAYLFSANGVLLTTFTNPVPVSGNSFGFSMASVGSERVLIGAPFNGTVPVGGGAAYLFSANGVLLTTFISPTPAFGDEFGISVAALGTERVLIGSPGNDAGADNSGAAYLFNANGVMLTKFLNPKPAYGTMFGRSVAAVGEDRVLIGTWAAEAAYLFSTNGALLATLTNLTPEFGDQFGDSVAALDADRVLIAASSDNTGAVNAGAAYLFSLETYTPGLVADGVNARSITTASLEDGAVTAAKIGGVLLPSQIPDLDASKITSGTLADARLSSNVARLNADQVFTGSNRFAGTITADGFSGSGASLTDVNAATVGGLSWSNFWRTGGNSNTTPDTHFIGTLDDQALELRVNGLRALRIEPKFNGQPNIIAGAADNHALPSATGATIGGGYLNSVGAGAGTIAGGVGNRAEPGADFASIGGGSANQIHYQAFASTIGGGYLNIIEEAAFNGTIGGGDRNTIATNADSATIGGGTHNSIETGSDGATIGGGWGNMIEDSADEATIGGGLFNIIRPNAEYAVLAGGFWNVVGTNAAYAAIPGGQSNVVTAPFGFAAGRRANANHQGAFVWGDSTGADITSTNDNSVSMRASGGYRLFTDSTAATGAFLEAGSGSWTSMSDRNAKENFRAADARAVLEKVVALPVQTWNYKSQDAGIRHIGPMAQDFQAAFGVGESSTGISTVDADGVALAAIQGLNQKLEETRAENVELKQRLTELESLVKKLSIAQTQR